MAIATHIFCEVIRGWVKVPVNNILAIHNVIYNSLDPDVRQPVDLLTLPLCKAATCKEINVHNEDGCCIPCLMGRTHVDAPKCGILINLEIIPQLFSLHVAHDEYLDVDTDILDIDNEHTAKINADSILPHFKTFIRKVQMNITCGQQHPNRMDDDNNDINMVLNDGKPIPPAIIASASWIHGSCKEKWNVGWVEEQVF
ncbi:uncharacterized protein BJ212DRAFT_1304851 [Suillus subaureus]|uniref:Uncharacterized protein n=1 Tax=Suillus subaureus TaxID=48587 RepID=A0A9P7DSY5_9AGAM|nr:uncharacterized protein BJ212DRAFT_1304851 [Suillus subaureus]KAG1802381.1 hypothetical protein BJ212DRAFT_1304851 [Suillus subaureus]